MIQVVNCRLPQEVRFTIVYIYKCSINKVFIIINIINIIIIIFYFTYPSWLLNMDAGMINGVLFLDLCKAFDTVNHKILVKKLLFLLFIYGIRNKSLDWFKSYLHNRKQFCVVNNATSCTKKVSCGIPQRSNLGPLLFLLYVNDLPNCMENSHAAMYADDTILQCVHLV